MGRGGGGGQSLGVIKTPGVGGGGQEEGGRGEHKCTMGFVRMMVLSFKVHCIFMFKGYEDNNDYKRKSDMPFLSFVW